MKKAKKRIINKVTIPGKTTKFIIETNFTIKGRGITKRKENEYKVTFNALGKLMKEVNMRNYIY